MNAKAYLNQIEKIDIMIENWTAEVNRWKEIANNTSVNMSSERVQSSGSHDTMENAICTYIDIERGSIEELKKKKKEIFKTLEQLNAAEYDFLFKAYVQKFTFKEIAYMKKKSYSWATTIHKKALADLQEILNKREGAK